MTEKSIQGICEKIIDSCEFGGSIKLFDIGCSYGTFLLQAKLKFEKSYNIKHNNKVKVYAAGCDYSLKRITLGGSLIKQNINDCEPSEMVDFRTLIFQQNIYERTSLKQTNIIFMFDKAFDPYLCLHCLFIAINSADVQYIVTCKKAVGWNYRSKFNFQQIILKTKVFELKGQFKNGKMTGSGESAHTFNIYEKISFRNNNLVESEKDMNLFLAQVDIPNPCAEEVINNFFQ